MESMKKDNGNRALICLSLGDLNEFFIHFCTGLFAPTENGENPAIDMILKTTLDQVPLFVNNDLKYLQIIARWRLAIAK
jgi:hypothetical protein